MNLLYSSLLTIGLSVLFYILEKKTAFSKINYKWRQIIIGVVFGLSACFSTEFGTLINGATMNVRDAAPLCSGLLFGGPAGIISGVIGGVHRWFAAYWGAGTYSQVACSISTVLAGVIAALMRKFLFDNKRPSWFFGLATGITTEVVHMLMLFFTKMYDIHMAFSVLSVCAVPMIAFNSLTVTLSVWIVSLIGKEKHLKHLSPEHKKISQTFQRWLLICVLVAFAFTSMFFSTLQTNLAREDASRLLSLYIKDVQADIEKASDDNLLRLTREIADDLNVSKSVNNKKLIDIAKEYDVSEINVVDKSGKIIYSTTKEYVKNAFNFASGEQSKEFLVLLNGKKEYVQKYQPIAYNDSVYMKYAGIALEKGGFVQVGYNEKRFRQDIDKQVIGITLNRHVGETGYLLIVDSEFNIVSGLDEKSISDKNIKFKIDTEKLKAGEQGESVVNDEKYYYMYDISEGYYVIAVLPFSEAMYFRDVSVYITVFMEILIFAGLFVNIYILVKKQVVENIQKVNNTLAEITDGNLEAVVNVRTHSEFASLSDDINHTVATLKHYISEAAARIDKELEFAKAIQHSALPNVFPPYPNRTDFEIYATMDTAKEVGGDFYDFYFVGEDKLAFLIADVSGKGIPAAMFMMTAKTIIKSLAESGKEVNDVFTIANEKLCENNEAGMFVTAFMGIIDLKSGLVKFANAGHNPPLVYKKGGTFEYFKTRAGLVLAGMEGIKYRVGELQLNPGDKIYMYTDGVTEATNTNNELYSEDRLYKVLNEDTQTDMKTLCQNVKADVDRFVGEADQFDDITMLAFNYKGETSQMKELTINATIENIEKVTDFVNAELEAIDCPMKSQMQIDIAIDELFGNIAHYAYNPDVGPATVKVEVQENPMAVIITFIDNGVPYDPLKKEDPDITLSAEEREIGGLGIFMVKKSMDDITYEYKNGQNILKIKKNL